MRNYGVSHNFRIRPSSAENAVAHSADDSLKVHAKNAKKNVNVGLEKCPVMADLEGSNQNKK